MEIEAYALLQYDKGHFLYSATTAQSTMDYLRKVIEDDIVDSLFNRAIILVAINLSSPLRNKGMGESSKSKCRDTNGAQHSLNLGLLHFSNNKLHKVGLLYRLPSSASQLLLCNLHF